MTSGYPWAHMCVVHMMQQSWHLCRSSDVAQDLQPVGDRAKSKITYPLKWRISVYAASLPRSLCKAAACLFSKKPSLPPRSILMVISSSMSFRHFRTAPAILWNFCWGAHSCINSHDSTDSFHNQWRLKMQFSPTEMHGTQCCNLPCA